MKVRMIEQGAQKTYAVIFDKDEEFIAGLTSWAKENKLGGSHFTAIGAFREVTLGYFDRDKKDYQKIPVREQVEVLSLIGDIALKDGIPQIHAHVVVGKSDGSAHGGHILEHASGRHSNSFSTESPKHLCRKYDPETGLALIDPSINGC